MYEICCNSCELSLHGNCYRTKCQHLLCETCACKCFNQGTLCKICGIKLHEGEVKEMLIGIISPLSLQDSMFQTVFQSTSWVEILDNSLKILLSGIEVSLFIQNQLLLESSKKNEICKELMNKIEYFKDEKNKMNIQLKNETTISQQQIRELEHYIQMREKELLDIKEAYNEKSKKCDSWENAYDSLRKQYENEKNKFWNNHNDHNDYTDGNNNNNNNNDNNNSNFNNIFKMKNISIPNFDDKNNNNNLENSSINLTKHSSFIPEKPIHFNQQQLNSFPLNQNHHIYREKTTYHLPGQPINTSSNIQTNFPSPQILPLISHLPNSSSHFSIPNISTTTTTLSSSLPSSKKNSSILMKQNSSPFFDNNLQTNQNKKAFFDKK